MYFIKPLTPPKEPEDRRDPMYVCHACAKSILPSELEIVIEDGVRMPYHRYHTTIIRRNRG